MPSGELRTRQRLDPQRSAAFRSALTPDYVRHQAAGNWLLGELTCAQRGDCYALWGPSGTGKTTFAAYTAIDDKVRKAFPGGVLWAQVGAGARGDLFLLSWAKALGILERVAPIRSIEARKGEIAAELHSRGGRVLLVVDGVFEQEHALAHYLGGRLGHEHSLADCVYLITTQRQDLAEWFVKEGGRSGSRARWLKMLNPDESLALFRHHVQPLLARHEDDLRGLAEVLEHQPYALSLLARYLKAASQEGSVTVGPALDAAAKACQRGLCGVIELAMHGINEASRRSLEALSVLPEEPASFSTAAAFEIADVMEERLQEMVQVGLIEPRGMGRYALHQLIAQQVRPELRRDDGRGKLAQDRMVVHYTRFVRQNRDSHTARVAASHAVERGVRREELLGLDTALAVEMTNIDQTLAVASSAVEPPGEVVHQAVLGCASAYSGFLLSHGWNERARDCLQVLHDALRRWGKPSPEIAACLARHLEKLGAYRPAEDLLAGLFDGSEGKALLARTPEVTRARIYHIRAVVAYNRGDFEKAAYLVDCGLSRLQGLSADGSVGAWVEARLRDGHAACRVICDLHERRCVTAITRAERGRTPRNVPPPWPVARESTVLGLKLARALKDEERLAEHLLGGAWLSIRRRQLASARCLIKRGRTWAQATGHLEYQVGFHHRCGDLALAEGNHEDAYFEFRQGQYLADRIAHRWYVAFCSFGIGRAEFKAMGRRSDVRHGFMNPPRKTFLETKAYAKKIDSLHLMKRADYWLQVVKRVETRQRRQGP